MGKVTTVFSCGLKMSLVRHLCKLTRFTITFCKYKELLRVICKILQPHTNFPIIERFKKFPGAGHPRAEQLLLGGILLWEFG